MTGPVIFLTVALTIWAAICLDAWFRERRQFEERVEMWADLLARLREVEREARS